MNWAGGNWIWMRNSHCYICSNHDPVHYTWISSLFYKSSGCLLSFSWLCLGNPMVNYTQPGEAKWVLFLTYFTQVSICIFTFKSLFTPPICYILPGSYFYLLPYQWLLTFISSGRKGQFLIKLWVTKNFIWGRNSEHFLLIMGLECVPF